MPPAIARARQLMLNKQYQHLRHFPLPALRKVEPPTALRWSLAILSQSSVDYKETVTLHLCNLSVRFQTIANIEVLLQRTLAHMNALCYQDIPGILCVKICDRNQTISLLL